MDAVSTQSVGDLADTSARAEPSAALRDVLWAFFSSRALVWVIGMAAVALVGYFPHGQGSSILDPGHLTVPFHHRFLDLLISPATRWDSAWFLSIAKAGYTLPSQGVFYPLYPSVIALGAAAFGGGLDSILGIAISSACAIGSLYLLHRLVVLDFDEQVARNTVWIFAWLPISFVLSAVYSEALFLLLAVGCIYTARMGRWAAAGLLGGLAALTRSSGVLLLVPLLILYLWGPRADRGPDRPAGARKPRYLPQPDILWIALVPIGLAIFIAFLGLSTGHPWTPFTEERLWGRHFIPLAGVPLGILKALWAVLTAVPGLYPRLAGRVTVAGQIRDAVELGFLVLAVLLLRIASKRLPLAYAAYAAISLAMAVSVPAGNDPLKSLPRFTLVMFPLWIALGLWATERRHVRAVIAVSAPLLALGTFGFVSWSSAA